MVRNKKIIFVSIFRIGLLVSFVFIYCHKFAQADAWLQKKGKGIFITSVSLQSMKALNQYGMFDKGKRAYQTVLNVYVEYGLTNRITIGAKTIGATNTVAKIEDFKIKSHDGTQIGMNAGEFFSRIGIIRNHEIFALAIATQIGIPSIYKKTTMSYFGIQSWSFETCIELGINFSKNDFLTLSVGWNEYFKNTYDEMRLEFAYGHYFIPEVLFMFRFQYFLRFNKSVNDKTFDFDAYHKSIEVFFSTNGFAKISFSVATPISKNTILESGIFNSIHMKDLKTNKQNIDLQGFYIGLWVNF